MICLSMSPFESASSSPHTSSWSCFHTVPGLSSSPLAPKGREMKLATAVLLTLLSVVLLASSCQARNLRVHSKGTSTNKSHPPAGKQDMTTSKVDGLVKRQADARSMVDTALDYHWTHPTELRRVAMAPPADSVPQTTPVVNKVSQRLFQRKDTGFHLDYAGPRTHPPSHN